MATQTHFISQIQKEEKASADMLKKLEIDNNNKLAQANEEANKIIQEAEEKAREHARSKLFKTKEEAKEEYKKIISDSNTAREDIIVGGKKNLPNAQKHITKAFFGLFE